MITWFYKAAVKGPHGAWITALFFLQFYWEKVKIKLQQQGAWGYSPTS